MKPKQHLHRLIVPNQEKLHPLCADYSGFVIIGAILALALLSGCASAPAGGASDLFEYNPNTGYPAVGSVPWH